MNSSKYLKLNRSEFFYYVMEDIVPSLTQLITLHFKTKHSPEKIRKAFRLILSLNPKLRSIIEPTLISYKFKIIEDGDPRVEVLFNDSFKVIDKVKYNTPEFCRIRNDLFNYPFKLQQSLPIKIQFLPDASVIFISLHHTTCDGVGWMHMVTSLLSYLNDIKPEATPLENPSMLNGLMKRPYILAPIYILKSFFIDRKNRKKVLSHTNINPSPKPVNFYGPSGIEQHFISHSFSVLRAQSKELGYSMNVFFLAAMARTIMKMNGAEKGEVVSIRLSYNLRPYYDRKQPLFGNYVTSSVLRVYRKDINDPHEMMNNIQVQLKESLEMLKNKNFIYPWLIGKVITIVGKKLYSKAALAVKRKQMKVFDTTFHFSTISNFDDLNKIGKKAQLIDAIATVPTFGLFITLSNIDGIFNINISYPTAEYSADYIKNIIVSFEKNLGELLKLKKR
jgi:NRPS condensation-like uncharacterized protein